MTFTVLFIAAYVALMIYLVCTFIMVLDSFWSWKERERDKHDREALFAMTHSHVILEYALKLNLALILGLAVISTILVTHL